VPSDEATIVLLEGWFQGARLWGVELDPRYRVVAITLEVAADVDVPALRGADDRRLQLLLYPVGRLAVRLQVDGHEPERFAVETLPEVVGELDGPLVAGPLFGGADLEDPVSLQGSSTAADGWTHRFAVSVVAGATGLELFATFDDVRVRSATGEDLDLATM
jgi:hypothetical protein